MIYKIPIIGFIYAGWKISAAQHAYSVCHAAGKSCWAEYDATWVPFAHFGESAIWSISFLLVARVALQIWKEVR